MASRESTSSTWSQHLFPRAVHTVHNEINYYEEDLERVIDTEVPQERLDAPTATWRQHLFPDTLQSTGNNDENPDNSDISIRVPHDEANTRNTVNKTDNIRNRNINKEYVNGTPIGLRVTQSVLKTATQSSLSFFHVAGMGYDTDVQTGPSISDTMDNKYSAKNTGMQFLVEKSVTLNFIKKSLIGRKLQYFVDKIVDSRVCELDAYSSIWYNALNVPMPECILRFHLNFSRLLEFDITLKEIAGICFGEEDWAVSPDFMGIIDIRIDPECNTETYLCKLHTLVCGKETVTNVFFHSIPEKNGLIKVYTVGSDVLLASSLSFISKGTISSNNVREVETYFGVEAASLALRNIIYADKRGVIPDFMTRNGMVCPFNKYSIEVRRKGLLTSVGFERPRDDIKRLVLSESEIWDEHPSIYSSMIAGVDPDTCLLQDNDSLTP